MFYLVSSYSLYALQNFRLLLREVYKLLAFVLRSGAMPTGKKERDVSGVLSDGTCELFEGKGDIDSENRTFPFLEVDFVPFKWAEVCLRLSGISEVELFREVVAPAELDLGRTWITNLFLHRISLKVKHYEILILTKRALCMHTYIIPTLQDKFENIFNIMSNTD
uniref:Uncharacterized protein n=1 Tax=Glossina austeni TaxID=7395 RepID=A0A1A9VY26_GLOAU